MPESAVKFGSYEVMARIHIMGTTLTTIPGCKEDGRTIRGPFKHATDLTGLAIHRGRCSGNGFTSCRLSPRHAKIVS